MDDQFYFTVAAVDFYQEHDRLKNVRHQVFVVEQSVDESLEWCGDDDQHWHVLATDESGQAIGTGRLSPTGKIGRMAVLAEFRNRGVGSQLLEMLLETAQEQHLPTVQLAAQLPAVPFYQHHGFVAQGQVFIEADIEHQQMVLNFDPPMTAE